VDGEDAAVGYFGQDAGEAAGEGALVDAAGEGVEGYDALARGRRGIVRDAADD
jgi:hypothetical protein